MKPGLFCAARAILWCLVTATSSGAQIAPHPVRLEHLAGERITGSTIHCRQRSFAAQADAFVDALQRLGATRASVTPIANSTIRIVEQRLADDAAYEIEADGDELVVRAGAAQGVAHAAATLLQLVEIESGEATWPRVRLRDAPDHPFRCFMVDMGRNPHAPEVLRQIVDVAWFYKVNYLHLHLSDDQLFSWPSTVFPKLYSERAGWTRDDFVALEAYSQARGVTVIPEIDVPGHSEILRRKYPKVFGKTTTDLASQRRAQQGIERLLAEILAVFRATPYVHIGGDEAYGVPATAQRDFINRLNSFIRRKGRRTLVWEGPPLGGGSNRVATDVIHLNWNTVNVPAQDMLDAGYEIVNAAWDPLYVVDHYPRTMFTAVSVERCYAWDPQRFAQVDPAMPTFESPHRTRTREGILGFCMPWWEGREENVLPLCVPRLAAVASAAWNRAGERDFASFEARQRTLLPRIERIGGFELPGTPFADAESQSENVAFRAAVTTSAGATQPVFGPDRLTNGITGRFDHFLGFPTQPDPLEITVELRAPATVGRVEVFETAIGESHEVYELFVSADGQDYELVGTARQGSRGDTNFVTHTFAPRTVSHLKIATRGCHGLTFPSFSRLTEIMAFAQ